MDDVHLSKNTWLKGGLVQQLQELKSVTSEANCNLVYEFWLLLSHYATVKDGTQTSYFISSALFATIRSYYEHQNKVRVDGVIYPSAMTDREGLNIAIVPDAVDEYLTLDDVTLFRAKRGDDPKSFAVFHYCEPVIAMNGKFALLPSQEMLDRGLGFASHAG